MMGPNVKLLVATKMALDAIPPDGGVADGVSFLRDPARVAAGAKAAQEWVAAAIQAVRLAADPNPWRTATDEEIAQEINAHSERRKRTAARR